MNMPPPRKTIAIVDDDASIRKAFDRHLTAAGYRCVSFASAEDFLLVAASMLPACVLADIHLEGMSGLQLALHPQFTVLNLPVALITGCDDPIIEGPAREIADAFLRKPVAPMLLLETVIDMVGPPIVDGDD